VASPVTANGCAEKLVLKEPWWSGFVKDVVLNLKTERRQGQSLQARTDEKSAVSPSLDSRLLLVPCQQVENSHRNRAY